MTTFAIDFDSLLKTIENALVSLTESNAALQEVCKQLYENVPYYNWVGFYFVDPYNPRELVLGPFVGEPTEHVRIPFRSGICGQAAAQKKIFIVPDVSKETNYLSCSPEVQSEIVIPIFKEGDILGELDIDSHQTNPFSKKDETFLKDVCELISKWI